MSGLGVCPMCSFSTPDNCKLVNHVCQIHRHDPNFLVYCSHCLRSYTKWDSYRKHLYRGCKRKYDEMITEDGECSPHHDTPLEIANGDGDDLEVDKETIEPAEPSRQWHAGAYLLKLKEGNHLTQEGVNSIVSHTTSLVSTVLDDVLSTLKKRLPSEAMETLDEEANAGLFSAEMLFDGIQTAYRQKKFFREQFSLIEPVSVELGRKKVWRKRNGRRSVVDVTDTFQYVPLLQSLKALLTQPDVLKEVEEGHDSNGGVLHDFCDGEFVRNHPLKKKDPHFLQLSLYYDDLEVANPLSSSKGIHKLGAFYWILLNVSPVYRSSLRFIQLLAIARTRDIKSYGVDAILAPAVQDLQTLAKDGVCVSYKGAERHYHGCLVAFLGDTPASNLAGGYKEGVGSAYRRCRSCMVLPEQICSKFNASQLRRRTLVNHRHHCELVETSGMEEHFSKMYGINRLSILDQAPYFDLTQCLPHDIMHVILEGVLPRHCKALLVHCIIQKRYFGLQYLHERITNFEYGYSENNAPVPFDRERLTNKSDKLGQTASQMWLLGRLLPLMVGKYVPEDDVHWKCYINLLRIVTLSTAMEVTQDTIALMTLLVEEYLTQYNELYPNSITPKLHYLVHLPEQMALFGPLRHQWCMRFEGKNAHIKRLAKQNFKNVPYSVATRHQDYMCMQMLSPPGVHSTNFLYKGDQIGKVADVSCDDAVLPQQARDAMALEFPGVTHLPSASTVSVNGVEFRPKALVCVKAPTDMEFPDFGEIYKILVLDNRKLLLVRLFEAEFCQHYHAYCLYRTDEFRIVGIPALGIHAVYHKYSVDSVTYTVIKSYHIVELNV